MKIVSVVGARPQFVKAAAVSRVLRQEHEEILVHTGQHYDYQMSDLFFEELDIPHPDVNLSIGSGRHGWQTGKMLIEIENVLLETHPDWVLVYGDTNSTLAAALAAAKLTIPLAHVEAGLRSFNRLMPEEINRVLTDHVSTLLFCPTEIAAGNLHKEGITAGVHVVGDVMYDAALYYARLAVQRSAILDRLDLAPKAYLLATIHRPGNTDLAEHLQSIFEAFAQVGETVVFPAHPRTMQAIERLGAAVPGNVRLIEPVGYLDMLVLERHARLILTDSGGVQKEAYFACVPCITLREETEWEETVQAGWNVLVGADRHKIVQMVSELAPPSAHPDFYGSGDATGKMVEILSQFSL